MIFIVFFIMLFAASMLLYLVLSFLIWSWNFELLLLMIRLSLVLSVLFTIMQYVEAQ